MGIASFRNRREAGILLSDQVQSLGLASPLVFAIPKGGLPVAREVAAALNVSLDIAPGFESITRESTEFSGLTADHKPVRSWPEDLADHEVLVVDDLIANGAAAVAAINVFKAAGAQRIIIATPVISTEAVARLLMIEHVEICAVRVVEDSPSVAEFFVDDERVPTDDEVRSIVSSANTQVSFGEAETEWIDIQTDNGVQVARWRTPEKIRGVVMVVNTEGDLHDSGSAVDAVVEKLDADGIATLSLTFNEYTEDVAALSQRIRQISNWLTEFKPASGLPLAYFGVGFGGAAMLEAAAATPERVKALVCYESPLHLIADFIPRVHAPTLVIVRDEKSENAVGNRSAYAELMVEKSIQILANAHAGIGSLVEPWISRFMLQSASAIAGGARAVRPPPRAASEATLQ